MSPSLLARTDEVIEMKAHVRYWHKRTSRVALHMSALG